MALPNSFDFSDGAGTVLLLMPDAVNDRPVQLDLSGETVVTPVSGVRYVSKDGSKPSAVWTFEFFERDRATLQFLKDFYDTQRGRAGAYHSDGTSQGFWFPTWQWDLEIANHDDGQPTGGHNYVWFQARKLADEIFPLGAQWRRWLIAYAGKYESFKATAAANDLGFDRLNNTPLNASGGGIGLARPWIRGTGARPLWLRYGRFDDDDFAYSHEDGGDGFRITCTIRELPDESA